MAQSKPIGKPETFHAQKVGEWRAWLEQNCDM
jgi:hypothetical protein